MACAEWLALSTRGTLRQMSIEAALCLALNRDACTAGVLTPASALGLALVDRLNASGMSLSVRALANDAPIELKQ